MLATLQSSLALGHVFEVSLNSHPIASRRMSCPLFSRLYETSAANDAAAYGRGDLFGSCPGDSRRGDDIERLLSRASVTTRDRRLGNCR